MHFIKTLALLFAAASLTLTIACSGGTEAGAPSASATATASAPTLAPEATAAATTLASAQPSATPEPSSTPEPQPTPEPTATAPAPQPTSPPAPTLPPAPTSPPVAAGVAAPIKGFGFPYQLTVPAGSTVVWTNYDSVPHDVTAKDDSWTSGLLAEGESYSRTFGSQGKHTYVCKVHPYMSAVLIVE
jgi:plastocyanin